jgi:hypothetical protein
MKFGIGEIILIIVIAFVVLLVVRIIKMAQLPEKASQYEEDDNSEPVNQTGPSFSPRTRIVLIGVLITILGVVVLFSSLSLIKWVFWGPIGALIAMIAGVAIVLLARKR